MGSPPHFVGMEDRAPAALPPILQPHAVGGRCRAERGGGGDSAGPARTRLARHDRHGRDDGKARGHRWPAGRHRLPRRRRSTHRPPCASAIPPMFAAPGRRRAARPPLRRRCATPPPVPFFLRFLDARRGSHEVKRSGTERDPRATARIGVAFPNRADPSGATNRLLWPDHLGGTRAPSDWP